MDTPDLTGRDALTVSLLGAVAVVVAVAVAVVRRPAVQVSAAPVGNHPPAGDCSSSMPCATCAQRDVRGHGPTTPTRRLCAKNLGVWLACGP